MTREEQIRDAIDTIIPIFSSMNGRTYEQALMASGFEEGVKWADNHSKSPWLKYKDKKPEVGVEVIAFNSKWIDEYSNPTGIRMGFINDKGDFASVCWWDDKECYVIISKSICEENSISFGEHIGNTEPTHWMPIPESPKE